MKRWACVLSVLVFLAGCSGSQTATPSSAPTGNPYVAHGIIQRVVYVNDDALQETDAVSFYQAMSGWNKRLGWEHFVLTWPVGATADLVVKAIDPTAHLDEQADARAYAEFQGLATPPFIEIFAAMDPSQSRPAFYHELGHAMGLPHVDDPTSIMYGPTTAHPGNGGETVAEPTDADVAAASVSLAQP